MLCFAPGAQADNGPPEKTGAAGTAGGPTTPAAPKSVAAVTVKPAAAAAPKTEAAGSAKPAAAGTLGSAAAGGAATATAPASAAKPAANAATAANASAANAHVVTAPWALIEKFATHPRVQTPDAETLKWEPPPLLTTPIPPPLTEAQRKIVEATQSDKLPEPTWDRYVISNEWRHDIVFPKVAGLGGVYIGVATDQNYTMAAAARAELLVLMDYDSEVVNMHRIYAIFMRECQTAEELRALFTQKNTYKAGELLVNNAATKELGAKLVKTYASHRERVATYLYHVANIRVGQRHPSWLGDPAAYSYIRGLVLNGRFLPVQGDLNGTVALKSIGETARALQLPVHIIYTSNAESFFKYNPQFRDNLAALPHDEKTVILRTYKHGMPSPIGDLWHFNLHQLDDFLERLALPGYLTIYRVMADLEGKPEGKKLIEKLGVSYYDSSVPRGAPAAPKPAIPAAPALKSVPATSTSKVVPVAPTAPGSVAAPGSSLPAPKAAPGAPKPVAPVAPGAPRPGPPGPLPVT